MGVTRPKAILVFASVVILVYLSLFSRRIPVKIQDALFFAIVLLEIAMIIAGWWHSIKNRRTNDAPNWRKCMALLGVIANTTAFAIPVGSLIYMMFYPMIASHTHTPMIDGEKMIVVSLVFSLCGVFAGIVSPARSRFAITLGSVIIMLLILSIPIAIL